MYCDFCSSAETDETIAAYCAALEKEIRRVGKKYADAQVSTIFMGGGTPTLVPVQSMRGVFEALKESFHILPDAEWTAEGNPGTITDEWLAMAVENGLNRLSLGVQAAQEHLLRRIGRIHTFEQARNAVETARRHGIGNLNLDAMLGLPGQTEQDYLQTLAAFRDLGAQHISAYSLILEEGTPLYRLVAGGQEELPDEDAVAAMYEHGIEWLENAGYERYEISNFARPGYACRHNIGYWQGQWYLGMGVAAHSMLPSEKPEYFCLRRGNATDVEAYIRAAGKGEEAPADSMEWISPREAMFETMMLSLRTTYGVEEKRFASLHGKKLRTVYGAQLERLVQEKLGVWRDGCFALTKRGLEMQNDVLMRFME